jgi:hypothetical protein
MEDRILEVPSLRYEITAPGTGEGIKRAVAARGDKRENRPPALQMTENPRLL